MAESCSEALSREIFLHTQSSTAEMYHRLDTLVKLYEVDKAFTKSFVVIC